jgi:hypothetical protein
MAIMAPWKYLRIISFILNNFISRQLIFTDSDFQEVVISSFLHKYNESEDGTHPFKSSAGFINSFKPQHGLVSRRIHYKWRPAVTEEQRQNWIRKIHSVFQTVPLSRIINCDETD